MQADPIEYRQLDLRAHAFLADVELHDVWVVELEGGGSGRTMVDLRKCFTPQTAVTASGTVKTLFAIRARIGALFGWDDARERWDQESYRHRLTDEERARSLVAPGSDDGLFKVVYVFANESVSEIRNATVHAFSCMSLRETMHGYRLYWGIYVKPISPWTGTYMRIIDPFRRAIVYPAVLNRISVEWGIRFCD